MHILPKNIYNFLDQDYYISLNLINSENDKLFKTTFKRKMNENVQAPCLYSGLTLNSSFNYFVNVSL